MAAAGAEGLAQGARWGGPLAHAVEGVEANASTVAVVVVGHPDALDATGKLVAEEGFAKVTARVSPAGLTRPAPPASGAAARVAVAVHDAARPLAATGRSTGCSDCLEAGVPAWSPRCR